MANTTKGLAIFANGTYMWLSEETEPVEAFKDFDENVGVLPYTTCRGRRPTASNEIEVKTAEEATKGHEFYEVSEADWEDWERADVYDHPDTRCIEMT